MSHVSTLTYLHDVNVRSTQTYVCWSRVPPLTKSDRRQHIGTDCTTLVHPVASPELNEVASRSARTQRITVKLQGSRRPEGASSGVRMHAPLAERHCIFRWQSRYCNLVAKKGRSTQLSTPLKTLAALRRISRKHGIT